VGILGANGSGKTTLIQLLQGRNLPGTMYGDLSLGSVHLGGLDQNYSVLDMDQSIFDNVRSSSALSDVDLRNQLAMFLFRGDRVWQKVSDLSGGERLRVGMAKLLLSSPPANCIILDEP